MRSWFSGGRATVLVVFLWIIGWGLGFGGFIEAFIDPHGETLDMWPQTMAVPGFIGGVVFAGLLLSIGGRRRLDDWPLTSIAGLGIATGFLLGLLAVATGASDGIENLSLAPGEAIGILTGLGAIAAVGTAIFFRLLAWRLRARAAGRAS